MAFETNHSPIRFELAEVVKDGGLLEADCMGALAMPGCSGRQPSHMILLRPPDGPNDRKASTLRSRGVVYSTLPAS